MYTSCPILEISSVQEKSRAGLESSASTYARKLDFISKGSVLHMGNVTREMTQNKLACVSFPQEALICIDRCVAYTSGNLAFRNAHEEQRPFCMNLLVMQRQNAIK
jgi:hypothetical protein